MTIESDVQTIVGRVEQLGLHHAIKLGDEYFYSALPLCLVDAIFSIGVKYEGTRNVVARYAKHARIAPYRSREGDARIDSERISDLVRRIETVGGPDVAASSLFGSRQRTSSRNGVLKSEAVYQAALMMQRRGVENLTDFRDQDDGELEREFRAIRGQGSGISWSYLCMLAGDDNGVKPDRMIQGFVADALGREVGSEMSRDLLVRAAKTLSMRGTLLTPRTLDYAIWEYQRTLQRSSKPGNAPTVRRARRAAICEL